MGHGGCASEQSIQKITDVNNAVPPMLVRFMWDVEGHIPF